MASRLLSILRLFPRAGAAVEHAPNSAASIYWWRRFFEMKEEEEQERIEVIAEVLELEGELMGEGFVDPICSEENVRARREFVNEGHKRSCYSSDTSPKPGGHSASNSPMSVHEQQQLHRPNLDIPVNGGESYITRAQ